MFLGSMNFDLGEDVGALRDMVHGWAQDRVKPMAGTIDAENAFLVEEENRGYAIPASTAMREGLEHRQIVE